VTKVLVFGTFDRLHEGHVRFLSEARSFGDRIVALVARDEFVRAAKSKEPLHSERERCRRLLERGLVEEALLSDQEPGTYRAVRAAAPDVICLGYDQARLKESLERWMAAESLAIPLRVLPRFPVSHERG
jgi:FAD synthetase